MLHLCASVRVSLSSVNTPRTGGLYKGARAPKPPFGQQSLLGQSLIVISIFGSNDIQTNIIELKLLIFYFYISFIH